MLKTIFLLLSGFGGIALTSRYIWNNFKEIRQRESHTNTDKFFNYPLMVIWFAYLLVFFLGLMINNLF